MKKLVLIALVVCMGICHKMADDDLDSLFEISPEEEKIIKERAINVVRDDEIVVDKPSEPQIRYFDDTPEFKSASEKYIYYVMKYKIEFLLFIVLVIFIFNFFLGKKINFNLANSFHQRTLEVLSKNFAHVGLGDTSNHELNTLLYNEFEFYASGRDNCKYCLINYVMKKRQDMFSNQLLGFIWPSEDTVFVEIGLESE